MEAVQARKQRLIAGALTDQEVRSARIEELKLLFTWLIIKQNVAYSLAGEVEWGATWVAFADRPAKECHGLYGEMMGCPSWEVQKFILNDDILYLYRLVEEKLNQGKQGFCNQMIDSIVLSSSWIVLMCLFSEDFSKKEKKLHCLWENERKYLTSWCIVNVVVSFQGDNTWIFQVHLNILAPKLLTSWILWTKH